MKTVTDPVALEHLIERLNALRPDTPSRWGKFTAVEMLCHLADATASVMTPGGTEHPKRPILKWIALRAPLAWPHNLPTPDSVNPKSQGTQPTDFENDRQRAIEGLRAFAAASAAGLASSHGAFGPMTDRDWFVWAYRHTDHHLRQFAL